jgi:hypothetical protein
MAIYYVDLLNGNDANNGTTFALRKKTVNSLSGTALSGDTIRVMKSSDATSIGSATWSNSTTITLPTAINATISLSENASWTPSTNITKSSVTNLGDARVGANACGLAVATAFTTGVIAYAPCATSDLSDYQQVSLSFRSTGSISSNMLYLDLCSDTLGATPIVSLPIPAITGNSNAMSKPITIDYGSALPSGVNSIALRAAIDPGTPTIILNNIIACKAPSAADSLTLNSIVGLNTTDEPEWYSIWAINGTTITLNIMNNWVGSTGSLTTYKMEPIKYSDLGLTIPGTWSSSSLTPFYVIGGGSGDYVKIEYGWDTSTMSSQTGYTVVDFQCQSGRGMLESVGNISVNKAIAIRTYGLPLSSANHKIGEYHVIESFNPGLSSGTVPIIYFDKLYFTCFNGFGSSSYYSINYLIGNKLSINYAGKIIASTQVDHYLYANKLKVDTLKCYAYRNLYLGTSDGMIENFICNNSNATPYLISSYNTNYNACCYLKIKNLNALSSTISTIFYAPSSTNSNVSIENFTYLAAPASLMTVSAGFKYKNNLFIKNYNNTGIAQGMSESTRLNSVTTPVHTAGGVAWEFFAHTNTTGNAIETANYYKVQNAKIGEIPVKANKLTTVKIWTRRKFTTTKAAFFIQPIVSGIEDYVIAESSAAANTWEELTITFTPTVSSVMDLYVGAQYDGTNASQAFYFDDLSVTIAD